MSARKKIYELMKSNGLGRISGEVLQKAAGTSEWARAIRQLSQDGIIKYLHHRSDNTYEVLWVGELTNSTTRSGLSSKDKYRIRNRDGHKCQTCGRGVSDGVELHVDHKIPVEWGGSNLDENLWVLCKDCNLGKKAFFTDGFDPKVMALVSQESSGYQKLRVLFENSPNVLFPPSILQGISGIRDWTRTIRDIREKHKIPIEWFPASPEWPSGAYSNVQ